MIAAKHMDPLVGVDIHITLIPTPAGPVPTPLPNPYVGMVFDVMDYIPFIGATVYINGLPRAVAGTSGQALPPHLPLAGPFAKPPTNESEIFMGSSTVVVDGSPQAFLAMPVLSCQDIGMPAPFRAKKKGTAKSLMLPTTVVLSIPMGRLVLIGGPPTIDMMAMAMKASLAGLKKLRNIVKEFHAVKAFSRRAHDAAEALCRKHGIGDRARNAVHTAICTVTGHPVDVATGKVFTEKVDFELPGPIPFKWERKWLSTSGYQGPLGHGWHHAYDAGLYVDEEVVLYRTPDGRVLMLPPLEEGEEDFNRTEKFTFARDEKGYLVRTAGGLQYRFIDAGRGGGEYVLGSISDGVGSSLRLHYEMGALVEVVDAGGRSLRFAQDGKGRIAAVEGPDPRDESKRLTLVRYRYDAAGNLVEVEDAKGQRASFEYQGHLLTRESDRNGLSFYFEYDGRDEKARCTRTWGDGGIYNHTLVYDVYATTVENSLGFKTVYHHRGGLVFKTVDALGNVTQVERNEFNDVLVETDALGLRTEHEYDGRGNEVSRMLPDRVKTTLKYAGDRLVEVTDAVGGKWGLEYDEKGRLAKRTNPLGQALKYFYGEKHLVGVADAAEQRTEVDFDAAGNLVEAIAPDGARSHWGYDALGRSVREVDARGNLKERKYDVLGRVVEVREPDGNVRRLDYDAEGNVVRVKDKHREVRFAYQGMGKVASRQEAGTTVKFLYDTEERLTGVQNEHGLVYRFELGPTGEVDIEEGFDGLRRRFKRDKAGRVVEVERPDGRVTKYAYDVTGRVLVVAQSDGSSHVFTYRADGEMVEAKNAGTTVKFERDALGRVVKEFQDEHWVESEYGPTGLRVKMKSSLGAEQEIQRNEMGDVMGVRAGQFSASFERDILGLETKRAFVLDKPGPGAPDAAWSKWERDAFGRPTKQHRQGRGTPETTRFYEWDVDDRLKQVGQSGYSGNWDSKYTHDAVGSLQSAEHWTAKGTEFERRMPDEVGNLFRTEDRSDRQYGPAGELRAAAGKDGITKYEYDADGNLSKKTEPSGREWTYEWNMAGMLVKVVRPDGCKVEFGYDALGRRTWKKFQGRLTKWVWDGNNPLHEWVEEVRWSPPRPLAAQDGTTPKGAKPELWPVTPQGPPSPLLGTKDAPITWLFEPESFAPLGKVVAGEAFGIVTDHLGTPIGMYNAKGGEVWGAELGIYGHLRRLKGPRQLCPFRWPGQYEDVETGLYYNGFRYYDPCSGAYVSQDPVGLEGGLTIHAYPRDPLVFSDPLGLAKKKARDCTPPPPPDHRGRIQAQGAGTEKSVAWARSTPPTRAEGLKMVDELESQLTPAEKEVRKDALAKTREFINRAADAGGVSAPVSRSFLGEGRGVRVDVEVRTGQAFVPR